MTPPRLLLETLDLKNVSYAADQLKGVADQNNPLDAKGNRGALKKEIEEYVQDEELRKGMDVSRQTEKNRERIETRTAYSSTKIGWMSEK